MLSVSVSIMTLTSVPLAFNKMYPHNIMFVRYIDLYHEDQDKKVTQSFFNTVHQNSAVRRQKTVSAYFKSKQTVFLPLRSRIHKHPLLHNCIIILHQRSTMCEIFCI